jgi:hypothetical protein
VFQVLKELGLEGVKKLRQVSPTKLVRGGAPVKVSAEVQHPAAPPPPDPEAQRRVGGNCETEWGWEGQGLSHMVDSRRMGGVRAESITHLLPKMVLR